MKTIYWLPRILSLGFILFLSLFSLDVFSQYNGLSSVLPFLIHLLPVIVLAAAVILSWKHDGAGAIIFLGLAFSYIFMVGFDRPWSWYAAISGPAFLVGILFLLSWFKSLQK